MRKFLSLAVISTFIVCILVSCNRKEVLNIQTSSDISSQQESSSFIASSSETSSDSDMATLIKEMNIAPGQEDIIAKVNLLDNLELSKVVPKDLKYCNPKISKDLKDKIIAWNKAPKYYYYNAEKDWVSQPSLIPYDQITLDNAHLAFPYVGQNEGVGPMTYQPVFEPKNVPRETFIKNIIQRNKNGGPSDAIEDRRTPEEVAADYKISQAGAKKSKEAWESVMAETAKQKKANR